MLCIRRAHTAATRMAFGSLKDEKKALRKRIREELSKLSKEQINQQCKFDRVLSQLS